MTMSDSPTPVHRSGYTLTILRKGSDGRWRIARDANLVTARENLDKRGRTSAWKSVNISKNQGEIIMMDKLHFSIVIKAPKEKVWDTMLNEDSYRVWTEIFMPGSHYVGDWNKGSKILFLAPGESGQMGGMVARIKENRPYEYVSIEHLGIVEEGKEDTSSEAVQAWAGARENYTFKEANGATEVLVDTDTVAEYKEMFLNTWPKALQKLKELAEQ